jgi:O-antigen ligase
LTTGIFAIIQQLTGGWMVPAAFWENNNSYRVTAWYGYPNGVGMYLAPMVPLAIYLVNDSLQKLLDLKQNKLINKIKQIWRKVFQKQQKLTKIKWDWIKLIIGLITAPVAILAALFAKSTAAMVGIAGGVGILLVVYQKTRWWTIGAGIAFLLILFFLPQENQTKQELLFQNRSAQLRLDMWEETYWFLQDRPVLGAGLTSYKERIRPYHQNPHIEIFHHPHNLLLTIWVNLGLIGLAGFLGIIGWFYYQAIFIEKIFKTKNRNYISMFALSTMTLLLIFGLVDSPYIKNDMAILFWLPIAMLILKQKGLA